jgi:hypothetical protein
MIDIKSCVLHSPVFIGAKNFKDRIAVKDFTGMKMQMDLDSDALYITWNGETARMTNNVAAVIPVNPSECGIKIDIPFVKPPEKVKTAGSATMVHSIGHAQVSTPHGLDRSKL